MPDTSKRSRRRGEEQLPGPRERFSSGISKYPPCSEFWPSNQVAQQYAANHIGFYFVLDFVQLITGETLNLCLATLVVPASGYGVSADTSGELESRALI